ncbi:RNA ligase/cyclic nucleotide phosphodiesterase [Phlyctochytrium arcticum]|nr:RNA ligase/cyclic nucleotide phosphodiesterase [Phlyctochytrium arcticum]
MTKFEMPTYSLWLCPSNQETNQTLRHVITTFSDRLGTPKWNPHITLQGGIEDSLDKVIERTQLVAKGIEPFTLTLDDVCIKELYFQCVMATPAPHTFLTNLNALTRHIFNKVNDPPFWPHLSLIYGDLDGSVKQALASLEDGGGAGGVGGSV